MRWWNWGCVSDMIHIQINDTNFLRSLPSSIQIVLMVLYYAYNHTKPQQTALTLKEYLIESSDK